MWRWPVRPTVREEEIWCCSWCYAATQVGGEWFEISRPPYLPMEMRRERTVADGLAVGASHAFGTFGKSLCGIQELGMSPSDHWWLPEREAACGACGEAAGVINELLQRCRSSVRTALAIDVMRLGLHRALRKIRQDFSLATPRSTGARAAASA